MLEFYDPGRTFRRVRGTLLTLSSHSDFVMARAQISRRLDDLAAPLAVRSVVLVLLAIILFRFDPIRFKLFC